MAINIKMPKTNISDEDLHDSKVDQWVNDRHGKDIEKVSPKSITQSPKRTTLVMDETVFDEMKIYCAKNKIKMKDFLFVVIIERIKV